MPAYFQYFSLLGMIGLGRRKKRKRERMGIEVKEKIKREKK